MVKSFTLLALGTMLIAGSAMAGNNAQKIQMNGKKADIHQMMKSHQSSALRGPKKELAVTDIITNPEGTAKLYSKTAVGYDWGAEYDDSGMAAQIVFGENNEVYFKDIISGLGADTYVKGEIDGDKITLPLPQTVYYVDAYDYGLNVCMMALNASGSDYEVADIESIDLLYDAESGVITLDLDEPYDYILGLAYTDDETWAGYGDVFQEYEPFDMPMNAIPAGAEVEEYVYSDGAVAYKVGVAIDGDKLYIKGLSQAMPDGVIVADIDGNVASINGGQLVGAFSYYFIYAMVASIEGNDGEIVEEPYDLQLDLDNNTIIGSNEGIYLLLNASLDEVYYLDIFNDFKLYVQESYAGTPANPYDLEVYDYLDTYGSIDFSFFVPNISTEGTMLDSDYLYYRIYVDGDIFELDEEYDGVDEPMENIPYDFQNGWDIYSNYGGSNRVVGVYMDGITTLGVQSVYIYEGAETVSDIITLDLETGEITEEPGAGIESITAADVMNVTYYDLNGRRVVNPDKGMYVVRMMLNDGSTVTRKVVRK